MQLRAGCGEFALALQLKAQIARDDAQQKARVTPRRARTTTRRSSSGSKPRSRGAWRTSNKRQYRDDLTHPHAHPLSPQSMRHAPMPIGDATREPAISPRLAPMPIGDASAASRASSGQPRTIILRMRAHRRNSITTKLPMTTQLQLAFLTPPWELLWFLLPPPECISSHPIFVHARPAARI